MFSVHIVGLMSLLAIIKRKFNKEKTYFNELYVVGKKRISGYYLSTPGVNLKGKKCTYGPIFKTYRARHHEPEKLLLLISWVLMTS